MGEVGRDRGNVLCDLVQPNLASFGKTNYLFQSSSSTSSSRAIGKWNERKLLFLCEEKALLAPLSSLPKNPPQKKCHCDAYVRSFFKLYAPFLPETWSTGRSTKAFQGNSYILVHYLDFFPAGRSDIFSYVFFSLICGETRRRNFAPEWTDYWGSSCRLPAAVSAVATVIVLERCSCFAMKLWFSKFRQFRSVLNFPSLLYFAQTYQT